MRFDNDDVLASYDLSYYSPLYQGATIYKGALLQTHGYQLNGFGSYDGLMYFDIDSHQFMRHIDLSNIIAREPQGVSVYNGKLIMNFSGGVFYSISLDINVPTTDYEVNYGESEEEFAYNIAASIEHELPDGFYVNDVDAVEIDYDNESFSADIYVQTPYCEQIVTISGTVIMPLDSGGATNEIEQLIETDNQDDTSDADNSDIQDESPDDENSENSFAEIDFG